METKLEDSLTAEPASQEIDKADMPQADKLLLESIDELVSFHKKMLFQLTTTHSLISSGAFKYSTVDKRKEIVNSLAEQADKIDDMSRAVIKGIRKVKRERLRDDDLIQKLYHHWALTNNA